MDTPASNRVASRLPERLGLLFLALLFVALTVWSWRKWTDPQIDFGLQLYTPWQLSQGKVLYRDVSYIAGGPLSQYFHALLFKIFSPSYLVVAVSNLVIAWLVTWGLFRLFARAADWFTASVIGVVTLCVFVFGHLSYIGNYNFITPYTCETVHGFALSLLAIACLNRWLVADKLPWLCAAGVATGGVFLTKPELFLALVGAVMLAAVIREIMLPDAWSVRWRNLLTFTTSAVAPLLLFTLYFVIVWPSRSGLTAAAGAWTPLLGGKAGHGRYYDWCMGLDVPTANLGQMLQYTVAVGLILAALAAGVRFIRLKKYFAVALIWLVPAGFMFSPLNQLEWVQAGRALPPLALASTGLVFWKWWQVRRARAGEPYLFPLLWSAFALLLLAKMGLNARLWQYGYYLALPATTLVLLVQFRELPPLLATFGVDTKPFRLVLVVFLAVGVIRLLEVSQHYYVLKTFPLAKGADRMLCYPADLTDPSAPAAKCMDETVKWLRANTTERETLAVLPEGAMVNYLARRANPTPYVVTGPHELQVAGETRVVAAFTAHPPDRVLLMHRSTSEFGLGFFGAPDGFGKDLMRLVKANYSAEWLLGNEPLVTNRFGMKMYRRNAP